MRLISKKYVSRRAVLESAGLIGLAMIHLVAKP
jgi:hypothetical protein